MARKNISEKSPIIETIKKVMPAVVSIIISKNLEELEKEMPLDLYPYPHKFLEQETDAKGMIKIGGGSGFLVHPNGIVITNKHVVADPTANYTVITQNGNRLEAKILARDPINDVAILKIEGRDMPVIELGDSNNLELGQTVLAIGNALGLFKNTVSQGIISGLSRSIAASIDAKSPIQEMRGLIQTDAAINPGNSGGPLVDISGKAIGINAAIIFGAQNISFAIPINPAKRDLSDLKEHGRIRRPFLGLRYIILSPEIKEKHRLPVDYGALVFKETSHDHGVVPNSPADKGGIKEKDIILECNGERITAEKTIQDFLENLSAGDKMTLKILRQKKEFNTTVTLSERQSV